MRNSAERSCVGHSSVAFAHVPLFSPENDPTQERDFTDEFSELSPTVVDEAPPICEAFIADTVAADELALVDAIATLVRGHALRHLPEPSAFPPIAARVLARRSVSFEEAVELGHDDVAIGAALLKAANSPLFYGREPLDDIGRAVLRLGARSASQIVTGVATRAIFGDARAEYSLFAPRFNRLFLYAMTCALSAERLVRRVDRRGSLAQDQLAFSAGLFHDIGKMVALRTIAALVLRGAIAAPPDPVVARVIEAVHVELGAALHARWSLSDELLHICACHHVPELPLNGDTLVLHIVRVTSGINLLRHEPTAYLSLLPEVRQSVRALRLERDDLVALDEHLAEASRHVAETFG
jgi:HD-like signal output (HDOD) protein